MTASPLESSQGTEPRRTRALARAVPGEGANGLFSQSWFPLCLADELGVGQIKGFDFLDGRVVAFRSANGNVQVLSAYCPHLGADLSIGDVHDDTIRCAFHHWQFDARGICVKTKVGDPPPPNACLFRFPTAEKHGLIWAFNGDSPHFEIPDFPYPAEELVYQVEVFKPELLKVDPWVICCNTPDIQHIKALHGISFDQADPDEEIEWTDHSMLYEFKGRHYDGTPIQFRVGIYGTSIYYQSSVMNGRWFGYLYPMGILRPGACRAYNVVVARRADGSDAENAAFLQFAMDLENKVVTEDVPIVQTIHFKPGTLSRSDKALGKFLQYLRAYPRAHPAAEFIS